MKLTKNFQMGGWVGEGVNKIPSLGEVWIFSKSTDCLSILTKHYFCVSILVNVSQRINKFLIATILSRYILH